MTALPLVNGDVINVRTLSLIFVIASLQTERPAFRGGLIGIATLFSQYSVFAIPVVWYDGLRDSTAWSWRRWTSRYVLSGLTVGILCYLPLLVWGPSTVVAGVRATFFSAEEYVLNRSDSHSLIHNPLSWARNIIAVMMNVLYLLVPAALVLWYDYVDKAGVETRILPVTTLLAGVFSITLFMKSLSYYWLPVVAFLAPLVAIGFVRFSSNVDVRGQLRGFV